MDKIYEDVTNWGQNWTNFVITHIRCDKLGTKFAIQKHDFCKLCDKYFDVSNYCDKLVTNLSLQNHYICKICDKYFDTSNYCDKICHIGDKNVTKS